MDMYCLVEISQISLKMGKIINFVSVCVYVRKFHGFSFSNASCSVSQKHSILTPPHEHSLLHDIPIFRVGYAIWYSIHGILIVCLQLLTEAKKISTVNHTVLHCLALRLCSAVGSFLISPHAQTDQATEWREFFQPALQDCLFPFFKETSKPSQKKVPELELC